jgi:hypothetical protein
MRLRTVAALAGVLVLSTACTKVTTVSTTPAPAAATPASPPAPALVNPVGRWTVALTAQGQAFDMVMELRAIEGNEFTGSITSQAFGQIPFNKATRNGNSMVIKIAVPTGDEGTINITFEGDTFSGDWSMPGDGSRVSGRRIVQ